MLSSHKSKMLVSREYGAVQRPCFFWSNLNVLDNQAKFILRGNNLSKNNNHPSNDGFLLG